VPSLLTVQLDFVGDFLLGDNASVKMSLELLLLALDLLVRLGDGLWVSSLSFVRWDLDGDFLLGDSASDNVMLMLLSSGW
jgi:hypothetical protein